jgi:hypothetical protein
LSRPPTHREGEGAGWPARMHQEHSYFFEKGFGTCGACVPLVQWIQRPTSFLWRTVCTSTALSPWNTQALASAAAC